MPDRADAAQRKLAAIWEPRSGDGLDERAPGSDPSRERQHVLLERLSAELHERAQTLGVDDPETIDAQLELANAQLEMGRIADAIPLLQQSIDAIDPTDPGASARWASATAALAAAHLSTRRPRLAIDLYESLLVGYPGTSSRSQLLGYRIQLAVAHRAAGDVVATVDQLRALSMELERDGDERHRLLQARVELATTNVVAGRPLDAVALYEKALPLAGAVHGADHRTTLGIRLMQARAYQQAGQSGDARRAYEQLVGDAELALGARDRLTVQVASELAVLIRTRTQTPTELEARTAVRRR